MPKPDKMEIISVLTVISVVASCTLAANDRPIIGILAQETSAGMKHYGDTYFYSDYVKLVELAGAKAVPIRIDETDEYYDKLFNNINGVLFPGGGVSILTSGYAKAAQKLYGLALQANDEGDYFPLYGICLGFELLTALTTNDTMMSDCNAENMTATLLPYEDFQTSKLYGKMPSSLEKVLTTHQVTSNFHHKCLEPRTFENSKELSEFYNILSHNYDRNGLDYVSTMEAKKYPIYGTQWHPEKNIYHYDASDNVNHSPEAIQVTQYMANFFVNEARKNGHSFSSSKEELKELIDNYRPVFMGVPTLRDIYFFNFTDLVEDEYEEEGYLDTGFDWIGFHVTERCKRGLKIMLMMFVMVIVTVTMGIFLRRWLQMNNQNMTYQHILSLSERYAMLDHGKDDSRLPKTTLHYTEYGFTNAPEKVSIAVPD